MNTIVHILHRSVFRIAVLDQDFTERALSHKIANQVSSVQLKVNAQIPFLWVHLVPIHTSVEGKVLVSFQTQRASQVPVWSISLFKTGNLHSIA